MRISDWSSDVCSSDLPPPAKGERHSRASVPALVLLCSRGQADEALANINGPPVKVETACIEAIGLEGTHRRSQARQRSIASPPELRTRPSHIVLDWTEGSTVIGGENPIIGIGGVK